MNAAMIFNSLGVGLGAVLTASVVGIFAALAWIASGPLGRAVLWAAGGAALLAPPFVVANHWLEWTSGWRAARSAEMGWTVMLPMAAMVLGLQFWPVTLWLVAGAWSRLPKELLEAEQRLRGIALFRWVLWPSGRGAMIWAATLVFVLALGNFSIPTLFQVPVFTEAIWVRVNTKLDYAGAWAVAWPLIVGPALVWGMGRGRSWHWPVGGGGAKSELWADRVGGWRWVGWSVFLAASGLGMGAPMGDLFFESSAWRELGVASRAGWKTIWNSAWIAAGTATLSVGLGYALSGRGRGQARGAGLFWVLFLMPGILLGMAVLMGVNRLGVHWVTASYVGVLACLLLRFAPLAWGGVARFLSEGDRGIQDRGRLDRLGEWEWLRRVIAPGSGLGMLAIGWVVYLLVLWEVESMILVLPPGGETLALRVFNLLHYGHAGHVKALSLAMMALGMAPLAFGVLAMGVAKGYRVLSRRGGVAVGRAAQAAVLLCLASIGVGCDAPEREQLVRVTLDSKIFSAVEIFGSRGVAPGQFNKPRSLTCDREGNLYVADLTGRIQRLSAAGEFLDQWQMPETDLGKPKGMGLDWAGNVVVVEPHYQRVNQLDAEGRCLRQWGRRGTNAGEFMLPRAVAMGTKGVWYLSEYTLRERVQKFVEREGVLEPVFEREWGRPGREAGEFNRPEGLCVGPDGRVYVADSCNHRIQVFDADGRWIRSHGRAGQGVGEYSYPYDIRVDAEGRQYVCEFGNSRITILDAQDRVIEVLGGAGSEPGQFANPWAIALDRDGNLYVADAMNHRVQKLIRRRA